VSLGGGNLQINGTLTNTGTLLVPIGQTRTVAADAVVNNATIIIAGSSTLSIVGRPGGTTQGNFTQGQQGQLNMRINSDTQASSLLIGGNATLAGGLNVSLVDPYQPEGQDPRTWALLSYLQQSGFFTSVIYQRPTLGSFEAPDYGPQAMT